MRLQKEVGDTFNDVSDELLGMFFALIILQIQVYCHFPGENELLDILTEVIDLKSEWNDLGLALGISKSNLDAYKGNSTECMKETIHSWLKQAYDVNKHGHPSWKTLCKAVNHKAGGKNPAAAEKIAQRHRAQ